MKKLLAFLTVLLFLLLVWRAWSWYKDTVVCCDETIVEEVKAVGPLVFDCNSDTPITSSDWASRKAAILLEKKEGEKLLVVAPYFDGETKELGLARAKKLSELFANELNSEAIELDVRGPLGDCQVALSDPLHKSIFKWVVRNENVTELHDKVFIYFEYDKTKEIDTENVVRYLSELIEEVKASGQSLHITGHTDYDGDEDYNYNLGLERAERVKNYLISKGVSAERITVESMGKKEPIADNTTEEGKQKNRRVEIEIK
ncbi:OmpA family protein [Namhaeicola litoreus]|uniref:OmpA family protein n=1 Tax=Namhaeicola litoreus TaxID=1052145 RepID=A0ABW3Y0V5_9FLAO